MARILVVDDDRALCDLLHDLLTEAGHEVRCAHHGLAALDEIGRGRPDLVVTDVQMPRLDGLGLLARLAETGVGVPVVLMSAGYLAAPPAGVAFVAKPFEVDHHLAAVEDALGAVA